MKPVLINKTPKTKLSLSLNSPALLGLFVMVFIMGLIKIYSPDLGFHLKSAEWIVENKKFIHTDSFNYVAEGSKYYDMQWLFQLLIYTFYKVGGEGLLVVANALLITFSFVLLWLRFLKNNTGEQPGNQTSFFALKAIIFVQALTFEIRPHVLSWIFLNLTLLFLESYKRGNQRALFILPVIILFWANTHSLSILGLVTIGIYNTGIFFEKKKIDKRLLLFSGLSLSAFLITPYFIGGLLYTFSQLGLVSGNSLLKSYIGEFQSPFTLKEIELLGSSYFTSPLLIIHLAAALCLFSIYRSLKQKQFTDTLLLIANLVILYLANKNYGYFLMVSLPLMIKYSLNWLEIMQKKGLLKKAPAVDKKKNKIREEQKTVVPAPQNQKMYRRVSLAAILIALIISVTSITDGYPMFRHLPFRFGFSEDKDQLPVEATAFLKKQQIKGRLLNHLDFGGYLMAHYNEKVFIDGRMDVLPEDFFSKYYRSVTEKNGIKHLLDEYNPDIVIFPYVKASYWWEYFITANKQSGYKPVYFDGLSVIYLKSSAFPAIPEVNEKNILLSVDRYAYTHLDQLIQENKPSRAVTLLKGLWQRQSFPIADQNMAIYCFTNKFDTAAISFSVRGIENSTVKTPTIYRNLALYYREKNILNAAQLCEEKADE